MITKTEKVECGGETHRVTVLVPEAGDPDDTPRVVLDAHTAEDVEAEMAAFSLRSHGREVTAVGCCFDYVCGWAGGDKLYLLSGDRRAEWLVEFEYVPE